MLSEQEKEKMKEHYRNRDLYDPSKAPEQKPIDFQPKMACGGEVGYAGGGDVLTELGSEIGENAMPIIDKYGSALMDSVNPLGMVSKALSPIGKGAIAGATGTTDQLRGYIDQNQAKQMAADKLASKQGLKDAVAQPMMPQVASKPAEAARMPQNAPQTTQSVPGGMGSDEYNQLFKFLSQKPGFGQAAMSGLGGLADAIMSGVARAPGPGFQKNIMEQNQQQKQNLADALKAKYGMDIEKARAAEEVRSHKATEGLLGEQRKLTQSEQELQAHQHLSEQQLKQNEHDMKIVEEYSPFKIGGWTKKEADEARARLRSQGMGLSQAKGLPTQSKVVGGKTYHQINGKWFME